MPSTDIPKRYHTRRKEILRFADLDLKLYDLDNEFGDFIKYIDEIDQPDPDALTVGQWKKLFAVLRKLAEKSNTNYCIYENSHGVFFDVTSNCLGTEDEISEENDDAAITVARGKESSIEKLKRYKYELDQIDLKIAHLQERRKEYIEKIEPLKMELATLLDDLSKYG